MRLSVALFAASLAAANGDFQKGDTCGVTSADFVNVDFSGDYLVAGEAGCTLGENTNVSGRVHTLLVIHLAGTDRRILFQCYCAPNLRDGDALGPWEWQCNGEVNFGPSEGKQCPSTVPVPKNSDILGLVPKQVSIVLNNIGTVSLRLFITTDDILLSSLGGRQVLRQLDSPHGTPWR